jgi:hypothetical protein
MVSSATDLGSDNGNSTAGERENNRNTSGIEIPNASTTEKTDAPELVAMVRRMTDQHMTDGQIGEVLVMNAHHVFQLRKRHKIKSGYTLKWQVGNSDDGPSPRFENDDMAEKFAKLMAGQSFSNNVKTKSYGKAPTVPPTHVRSECNLARC